VRNAEYGTRNTECGVRSRGKSSKLQRSFKFHDSVAGRIAADASPSEFSSGVTCFIFRACIKMSIELTEKLLSDAAGWDVMKFARASLAQGQVVSSHWAPPLLRGVVQSGGSSIRASMVIKSNSDIDNLCTCREAREWGKICTHGGAVGLHWLNSQKKEAVATATSKIATKKNPSLLRADDGEPAELFFILPPNF